MNLGRTEQTKGGRRRRRKKNKAIQALEYGAARLGFTIARLLPIRFLPWISKGLGRLFYRVIPRRRNIALENVRNAFPGESEEGATAIARQSFSSFVLTVLETLKFEYVYRSPNPRETMKPLVASDLANLFEKVRRVHETSRGCIFVSPHVGNWEFLPHVIDVIGIPVVIIARPLGNVYLERRLYKKRAESGMLFVPKKSALMACQRTLQQGKSIGLLADQSSRQGVSVEFFGRQATVTPLPAYLSVLYERPVVVVACCRTRDRYLFEGIVSDPIYPGPHTSQKEEILRITRKINEAMEAVIRQFPEQYFWMHDRWKTYRSRKALLA